MAPGLMKTRRQKEEEVIPTKLCAGCRRTCKQPSFAKITSCPRYYPLGKKQAKGKEWKQQDLFADA